MAPDAGLRNCNEAGTCYAEAIDIGCIVNHCICDVIPTRELYCAMIMSLVDYTMFIARDKYT